MPNPEELAQLDSICAGAKVMIEGDSVYIFLPALKLPAGVSPSEVDALLRIKSPLADYATRLFFRTKITSPKSLNWNALDVPILQQTWSAYSWINVAADRPLIELVSEHLRGLI